MSATTLDCRLSTFAWRPKIIPGKTGNQTLGYPNDIPATRLERKKSRQAALAGFIVFTFRRPTPDTYPCCLLEQSQNRLGLLIGLSEHRGGGLRNDLRLGQTRGFRRIVSVHDSAA